MLGGSYMNEKEIAKFREQHEKNYRSALIEITRNNTDVLVNQDITSLLQKPPLDSMDLLKSKVLDLSKRNKIVIDMEKFDKLLNTYRKNVLKCCDEIRSIRNEELEKKIKKEVLSKNTDTIKFNKKDFVAINKRIKKLIKDSVNDGFDQYILKSISTIFIQDTDSTIIEKFISEYTKFGNGNYQKQLLENFDIKILVKDTTLINSVKEQGERYLFTLNHSKLLNDSE